MCPTVIDRSHLLNIHGQSQQIASGQEVGFFILTGLNRYTYKSIYIHFLKINRHLSLWTFCSIRCDFMLQSYSSSSHNFCFNVCLVTWLKNWWNFNYVYFQIFILSMNLAFLWSWFIFFKRQYISVSVPYLWWGTRSPKEETRFNQGQSQPMTKLALESTSLDS